jgi:hypothetical protein
LGRFECCESLAIENHVKKITSIFPTIHCAFFQIDWINKKADVHKHYFDILARVASLLKPDRIFTIGGSDTWPLHSHDPEAAKCYANFNFALKVYNLHDRLFPG